MSKGTGEAVYWKERFEKRQGELTLALQSEIKRANIFHAMALLFVQRDNGCQQTGMLCDGSCRCHIAVQQGINFVQKLRGFQ